jgi:hypothetical protein
MNATEMSDLPWMLASMLLGPKQLGWAPKQVPED